MAAAPIGITRGCGAYRHCVRLRRLSALCAVAAAPIGIIVLRRGRGISAPVFLEPVPVAEPLADDLIGVRDDDKRVRVDVVDDVLHLVDLLRLDAGHQDLAFALGVHPLALDQRDAARAVRDQRRGDLLAAVGDDVTLLGLVQAHDEQIARLGADKDEDERVKYIFRVAHGDRAGDDDDRVQNGEPDGDTEEFEPVVDLTRQQFGAAAGDFEFDKDADAQSLQDPAVHGRQDAVVRHAGDHGEQLVEGAQDDDGQQAAQDKFPAHLLPAEQEDGDIDGDGHDADADHSVREQVHEGRDAGGAAPDDLVVHQKAVDAQRVQAAADQHGPEAQRLGDQ